MHVIKESGKKEDFSAKKLCGSLEDAGAPQHVAQRICNMVADDVTPDTTTRHIWRTALGYLVEENLEYSARYSLRHGLAQLGPTGFLFEQFVEAVLQAYGYTTQRDVHMQGGSGVLHEIDVVAQNSEVHALIEAKYRNQKHIKTHIDVVMYGYARLLDIEEHQANTGDNAKHQVWVVTNTKFTKNAIMYAKHHSNVRLLGWGYPHENNLERMVVEKKMYPITVLPGVDNVTRKKLTDQNIILVRDILPYSADMLQRDMDIPAHIGKTILANAHRLLGEKVVPAGL